MPCKLRMLSQTHAMHIQKILIKAGYTVEIERIYKMKNQGCGYEVKTNCPYNKAVEFCKKNNILLENKSGDNI